MRTPVSSPWSLSRLLRSRRAPETNTSESATSPMTMARRIPECALEEPRADRFKDSARLPKAVCMAGSVPASRATATAMAPANASTRKSSVTAAVKGIDSESIGIATRIRRSATAIPAIPPRRLSTRLSVSNCPTRRQRPAPRAARTASSLRRVAPLASSRLATFAQAISRTIATAPKATEIDRCKPAPTSNRARGSMAMAASRSSLDASAVRAAWMACIRSRACVRVAPPRRRP